MKTIQADNVLDGKFLKHAATVVSSTAPRHKIPQSSPRQSSKSSSPHHHRHRHLLRPCWRSLPTVSSPAAAESVRRLPAPALPPQHRLLRPLLPRRILPPPLLARQVPPLRTPPFHVLTLSDLASVIALLVFFGIDFVQSFIASLHTWNPHDEDEEEEQVQELIHDHHRRSRPPPPPPLLQQNLILLPNQTSPADDDEETEALLKAVVDASVPSYSLESKLGDKNYICYGVGTVGGGTQLGSQAACLNLLGVSEESGQRVSKNELKAP